MKKIFLALFLFSSVASADGYYGWGGNWWIGPTIINPNPVIVVPQPYYYQPQPYYYQPYYYQPYYQQIYDQWCNCYRTIRIR